jgi:hypothetical protein
MGPVRVRLCRSRSSETAAGARPLICSLDGDRNLQERSIRSVVRCMQRASIQRPTDNRARGLPRAFVEARSDTGPDEFLELAWIVRKKPIWSPS